MQKSRRLDLFFLSIDGIELLLIGCSVVVLCSKVQKSAEIEGTACLIEGDALARPNPSSKKW